MRKRVCVFCGSSPGIRASYAAAAVSLAKHLASRGIAIVYGGSRLGLMGILADAALAEGMEVTGVIPSSFVAREVAHSRLSELRIVNSMHERKAMMAELADGFIALPGGYGTFEEFCEVVTWNQLGLQNKPCGLLNTDGYYDSLLKLFDHAVEERFLKPVHRQMVISDSRPEALVERLFERERPRRENVSKWMEPAV